MEEKRIKFIDYVSLLVAWRKLIVINFFVICLLAAGISLIIPKTYQGWTVVLPSQDSGDLLGLSSLIGDLPSIPGLSGMAQMSGEVGTYLAILNSRSVLNAVIQEFDLKERYKTDTLEETRKQLRTNLSISLNDDGSLSLATRARTGFFSFGQKDDSAKVLARDMANFFIEQLDRVNKRLRGERARNNRFFIEQRYQENLLDLAAAEDSLKEFQEKNGVIALPEQTEAAILAMAELRRMLINKEIEKKVLVNYVDTSHPDIIRLNNEIAELQKSYNRFIVGPVENGGKELSEKRDDILIPIEELPDLAMHYARFFRQVVIETKIQETLLPLYEQAKIQEAKETPAVQILDYAELPEKKSKPKRAYLVLFAGFFSLVFTCLAAYGQINLTHYRRNHPENYRRWIEIKKALFVWK